jgi:hypothetical protein
MLSNLLYRLRALFRRAAVERELDEELRFHVEREAEKYVRAGLPSPEAARQARLKFGGSVAVAEACRDARGLGWLESSRRNLRYALRLLRRHWRSASAPTAPCSRRSTPFSSVPCPFRTVTG